MEFSNKVAIVTGAAQGLGYAISKLFTERGANVCMLDLKADQLQKSADSLGANAHAFPTDCTDKDALIATREQILSRLGYVDILVNNAGGWKHANIWELQPDMWDKTFNMNAKTAFLTTQTFMDNMIERKAGRIVCIVSIDAYTRKPTVPDYGAAKAAVASLVKTFAAELAPHGILVNGVAPGSIATEIAKQQDWLPKSIERIPTGRAAEPEDIAEVVAFLASDRNRVVAGETVIASGGELML